MNVLKSLSPIERRFIISASKELDIDIIKKDSGLEDVEIVRALTWLEDKKLLNYSKEKSVDFIYTKLGSSYLKEGLPERIFLNSIKSGPKLKKDLPLDSAEINACIGLLKKEGYINVSKTKDDLLFSLTDKGVKGFDKKLSSELIFENKSDISYLKKRGLVEEKHSFIYKVEKLLISKEDLEFIKSANFVERVTSDLIKKDEGADKAIFRHYDITAKSNFVDHGKKHFVTEAVDYIKNIWIELGFEELKGDYVQSAFWNLDALFTPQDHPAREMQDTFYVAKVSDIDGSVLQDVKAVHEDGAKTKSKGWQYSYSEDKAKETLLRTHTTVLTAIKLKELSKNDLPKKYFSVDKVFRNEALDWKHLFEFQQVEGIVIDESSNFVSLKSYLKDFFGKMGYTDVRLRPAYFPYTEPSAEVDAFHPVKKEWVELGGAGILRPEVTQTLLGIDVQVLAWGLGMERIISAYYGINDLREIYNNDLKDIRTKKVFLKRG